MVARRRPNHDGSIFRRKDGRWCAYVSMSGRRVYHYGHSQRECLDGLAEQRPESGVGLSPDARRITVAEYLQQWAEMLSHSVKRTTSRQYACVIRVHIIPALGAMPILKLRPDHIQAFYLGLERSGAGVDTIRVVHNVLSKSFRQAVTWRILPRSPVVGLHVPRRQEREMTALMLDQAHRLLEAMRGYRLEALFVLAITTGMRQGELLGLRWSDVDWDTGSLRVRRQWSHGAYGTVKTRRSERLVSLGPKTVAALLDHRDRQKTERGAAGDHWQDGDLIFSTPLGRPINRKSMVADLHRFLADAGLPRVRFHDLRHTAATAMLQLGINPKIVQERLGHSSIVTTLDTYSHVVPTLQREAADILDARLLNE